MVSAPCRRAAREHSITTVGEEAREHGAPCRREAWEYGITTLGEEVREHGAPCRREAREHGITTLGYLAFVNPVRIAVGYLYKGVCLLLFLNEVKMPVRPDPQQLEKFIDDALRKNDFKPLMILLQIDIYEDVKIKCSKQFLHKLDDLICRELNKKDIQMVSNIFISVGRCSKNILILGQAGLLTMLKQGLVQKISTCLGGPLIMGKSKDIILSQGQSKNEAVMNMIEDFFDLLMVVYDINNEGKKEVLENFIPCICALIVDSRVNICIQQEALKKMNLMLDRISQDANRMLSNQEIQTLMSNMGKRILDVGDYEVQVGIVEALCRMTTEKRRQELACQWFSMDFIANAFKGIKDCDFETDCRIFLNLVNGMLGDKRRVFTFPCLSAFLDKYELQIPSDEKLEEFWIDFNLGSQTLSFYIAGDDDDDHQWEAVTVHEEKVEMYNIEVKESKKLLTITLKNIVKINKKEGKELLLYFDASLEITNVTKKIFGGNKCKEFARKQGISVAKTSIHILFDASGSQILVPESQPSQDKEDPVYLKEKSDLQKKLADPSKQENSSKQEDRASNQDEIITPSRKKMSEASMIVPDADRYTVRSPVLLINTSTPPRRRRPPLQAVNSARKADVSKTSESEMDYAVSLKSGQSDERKRWNNRDKHNKTTKVVENKENEDNESPDQNFNETEDTFSDVYAMEKIDESALPGVTDISKNKAHSKWSCWTPVTTIKLCNINQRAHALPGPIFIQDTGVNKKSTKQKSESDDSEETQGVKYRKDIVKCNKSDGTEVCEGNNQEQNHPKDSHKKKMENAKQSDWHIESETTYKSICLNKTTEESLIYKKTCVLSKDVNTICDRSPSRRSMRNLTKSRKELTSELNSYAPKEIPVRENSKGKGFTRAAESLISQINKRYNPSDSMKSTRKLKESLQNDSGFSKKSDLQLNKVQKKSYRKLKTTFVNVTSKCLPNDVYNFSLNGTDEPVIKLGIQEFQATTREASMNNSIKLVDIRSHDEQDSSFKTKNKRMLTSYEKTLFSDTETECGFDDSKTDISWLREPKSKRLMDYSRNKNMKKYKRRKSRSSLEKRQPRSIMVPDKNITKKSDEIVVDGRTRLPRRATKTTKNYKDLSTSESEPESENQFSHLFKDKLLTKEENIHSRAQTKKLPKKQQTVFTTETPKRQPSEKQKISSELRDGREDSLYLSSASVPGSPSSVEVMRCQGIEKKTERDFSQDYDYITKSFSPYLKTASSESLNGSNKVGGQEKSPRLSETSILCIRKSCSPVSGLSSLPRNTPTKNNSVMNRKNTSSVIDNQRTLHYTSYSDVSSNNSEKNFMETECPDSHENHIQSKREESHEVSPLSLPSERMGKMWLDMPSDNTHVSGPSQRSRKQQMYLEDDLSNSSEAKVEEAEEREQLFSKRLCQREDSDYHIYKSSLSTPDFSVPEDWLPEELPDAGMFYDNVKSVYKRKADTQRKIMDDFTTEILKLTQQHLTTMIYQARRHRDENLNKLQATFLDELEKAEKESHTLQDLEKELVDIGEKLVEKMRAYHRNEQARLRVLKTSLDKSFLVCNSVYEETIFISEMRLMKANMKMLQNKLLKEMHEEELLNIRRGLSSLFKVHEENDV